MLPVGDGTAFVVGGAAEMLAFADWLGHHPDWQPTA
jgi:hypothetical protein